MIVRSLRERSKKGKLGWQDSEEKSSDYALALNEFTLGGKESETGGEQFDSKSDVN